MADRLRERHANVPTQAQIDKNIELLENGQQFWSFGNTPLPDSSAKKGFNPSTLAPFFHQLLTDLGLNPPPLNPLHRVRRRTKTPPKSVPVTDCGPPKLSQPRFPVDDTELDNGNLNTAPVAPDSQVTKDVSTQAQQDVQSITPAATEAPADAAAVPNNADTEAGQTLATDTTRDGNMAVPGKVGGNGTNPRGELRGALRSAADQISSSISKVTGGLTGGTKSGETSTGAPRLANPTPAAPRPANPAPAAPIATTPAPAAGTGPSKERYRLGCAAVRCGHCGGGFRRHRGSDPVAGWIPCP